ncbi:hypothetical protein PFICI_13032 [Pestalotiopsis fici W106-1]|uniref:Uncharacterized protein n=1 Tax=Pestalotiopsis fici (strain W106-1 / CGMCC3.15140) TaxID=1229662 RepID=W3WKY5_PESFW|nr:uncharacterized protein PFICI_13032 [Pestalotiopsis fici W106-1]ETS74548.1 hypothetical protein PFICI_13032 [Pestalotiopsis fici W106-1]
MAFHQPTRQATQRVYHPAVEEDVRQVPRPAASAVDESQTWVLFSPINDAATTTSYLTETHRSESTPGRSRLSDLGSVHTIARSDSHGRRRSLSTHEEDEEDDDDEEDDAELDSLDSHLPEFRSTPHFSHSAPGLAPIVPAHDGLGSFRLDHDGMGPDIQDRLYAFERYNPRRVKRRRESLELAQVELDIEQEQEIDKMGRIEAWRLEQSRCLLEEIQKETRRRRRSAASARSTIERVENVVPDNTHSNVQETLDEDDAWHEQQASDLDESETFLGRITRKVIRDIMGIDDKLLSILFGESLPDEDDLSSTPKASTLIRESQKDTNMTDSEHASWQLQMLERIAKELGSFVYQLSEHPGAFSTYTRMQQMPIPYAGLPPIAETTNDMTKAPLQEADPRTSIPEFKPTIPTHSSPIDVPQTKAAPAHSHTASHITGDQQAVTATAFTQDEWEQDLDVRLIFRYLRSRFLSRSNSTGNMSTGSHPATSSNQDAAAKAARVRQHHPLVSKIRPPERRSFRGATPTSPVIFRRASSCASQSTRKSVRRSSCSSRHYWDIGAGSVGTGSLIAAAGPMGSWGEI